jgi:exonuclease SbcC
MKPLKLKIAGLQSFREEQEIHFDQLSERGVFGIFGPTGSGKSTILDAVTLALFGKVVRAKNKTQGILNTSEKKLSISFLFELNVAGEKKKYRVDRRYSKKDEILVKHDHSRLVEIDQAGLDVVLTEGDTRVTGQVEDLLGMKAEDFTRAVVLPQGKFAEFLLNLEGIKRKEMLQRLFSLERYGKLLTERLNKRVDRTRLELTSVESELAGLGNASEETLDEAAKQMEAAKKSEGRAAAGLYKAQSRFDQAQKIWGLQVELGQVEKDQATHGARGGEITRVGTALGAAERAAKVVPLVKARDEASAEKEKSQQAVTEAEFTAESCRVEALAKKDLFNLAQERRENEGPKLIALKAGLEAAQKLEEEVKEIAAEIQECKSDRQLRLRDRAGGKEKAEKENRRKTALQEGIKQEEENIALNTVTGSRREKVLIAKQEADRCKAAGKTLSAAEVEVQNRQAALTASGQELEEAEKALAGLDERVRSLRVQEQEAVQPAGDEELT